MLLPDEVTTLAEHYHGAGFATAGYVTNINFDTAFNFQQGFDDYAFFDAETDSDGLMLDSSDTAAVDAALSWAGEQRGKPIFLWVHLMAPHSPYLPPADLRPQLEPGRGEWFNVFNMPFANARVEGLKTYFDRDVYLDLYTAETASVDRDIARLLAGLDNLGVSDDAHVIFVSDHGEAFGEADTFSHGHSPHVSQARVPFIWKLPGARRAGSRLDMTVQAADIAPTLLTLAAVEYRHAEVDGRDISAILVGETAPDDGFAFTDAGYVDTLGARGLKYAARSGARSIWLDAGFPYVSEFDRRADPQEHSGSRYRARDEDWLYATLVELVDSSERQLGASQGPVALDAHQQERLRALGYMH
jgi:arylsulfatase A-like enzyme